MRKIRKVRRKFERESFMAVYPLTTISHEGLEEHSHFIFFPSFSVVPSTLENDDMKEVMARWGLPHLARINTDEYVSRSGCHEVRISFKPLLVTRHYEYYAYFPLFLYAPSRARFGRVEDIADVAYKMYIARAANRHPRAGFIAFKVASGWCSVLLVRPAGTREFFEALALFNAKIYPMLLLVY